VYLNRQQAHFAKVSTPPAFLEVLKAKIAKVIGHKPFLVNEKLLNCYKFNIISLGVSREKWLTGKKWFGNWSMSNRAIPGAQCSLAEAYLRLLENT
jgi:hypothetical protein